MPERDGYIFGVPCWVDVSEPDLEAALGFYGGLFGWEFEDAMPPSSEGSYFVARATATGWSLFDQSGASRGGDVAAIGSIAAAAAPPSAAWNTYLWVDSADEIAARVRDAGGTVGIEPFDFTDAARVAVFTDPEGAAFRAWEAKGHKGAGLVNDPGSVNFNGLNTRDIEGARSFYGSVFGWETLAMGGVEMWTLRGYGDYLEGYHPGLRKQMAEAGAPERFEDVVAQIVPITDDQPDTPAHWSVTFATDDADATASKAVELGGSVIVPPFDAPWVRMTVLADPQGATFIASKFAPENKGLEAPVGG
jgi:predicted enzyme related to lactoylglutathione lyase